MVEIDQERLAGAVRIKRCGRPMGVVAAEIGMSTSTVCRIELGKSKPNADGLLKLACWMNRDPREFAREVA